jgi:hypothetical protein
MADAVGFDFIQGLPNHSEVKIIRGEWCDGNVSAK